MSIKRRIDKLENRTPRNSIKWDGRPETAEAFVRALTSTFTGNGPQKGEEVFEDYPGDDPQAYVEQALEKE